MFLDELLDIVDENDNVVSQKLRSEVYSQEISNFRVVNAFLINDLGELWIPRRTSSKKLFPSCLDCSMGGHVSSGETYEQAFKRELLEELNIDANLISYNFVGDLNPYMHKTSAFMKLYLIESNQIPNYNKEDFAESFWLSPQAVLKRLESGDKSKSDLPKIINFLLDIL